MKKAQKKVINLAFLILVINLGVVMHGRGTSIRTIDDPRYGGTFFEAVQYDAQLFNPIISSDPASQKIESFIFESLLTFDISMNLVPELVKTYDTSSDKLDYTFHLREDVYWHDGEPFTADDVIFTWDRIMDPETDTTHQSKFELLDFENVPYEKIDDHTVTFHLADTFIPMLDTMVTPIIPQHAYGNYLGPDGIAFTADDCRDGEGQYTFNTDPINTASEGKKPIGTGCMMFEAWEVDESVTLIRNSEANGGPGYWNNHDAYLDSYVMNVMTYYGGDSDNTALEALQNNTIQCLDLYRTQLDDIQALQQHAGIDIYNSPVFTSDHIAFQCDPDKGHLYDQDGRNFEENPNHLAGFAWQAEQYPDLNFYGYKVRQALNYAIDKQELINYVYPYGIRNLGPMYVAQTEWYNEDINPYTYNLTKANQLLADAGFGSNRSDTGPKGNRSALNFTITHISGNLRRQKTCQYCKEQWAKLGITVTIESKEIYLWVWMNHRDMDAFAAGWTGGGSDPDLTNVWSSRNIRSGAQPIDIDPKGQWIWDGYSSHEGLNYASYWNPQVDQLLDIARTEEDPKIRHIYYDHIQELIVEDSPYIWLYSHINLYAVNASFTGFVNGSTAGLWPAPIGFHNIHKKVVQEMTTSQLAGNWLKPSLVSDIQILLESFSNMIFNFILILILLNEMVALVVLINIIRQKRAI